MQALQEALQKEQEAINAIRAEEKLSMSGLLQQRRVEKEAEKLRRKIGKMREVDAGMRDARLVSPLFVETNRTYTPTAHTSSDQTGGFGSSCAGPRVKPDVMHILVFGAIR